MKGEISVEMAKVTSKGQITIPVSIRRRLNVKEGDKLLFIDNPDGVVMVNPDTLPAGQDFESTETEILRPEIADVKPRVKPTQSDSPTTEEPKREAPAQVKVTEKPGKQINGLDIDALLNEIRSIGSI